MQNVMIYININNVYKMRDKTKILQEQKAFNMKPKASKILQEQTKTEGKGDAKTHKCQLSDPMRPDFPQRLLQELLGEDPHGQQ